MHSSVRHLKEFVSHLYPIGVVKHQTSPSLFVEVGVPSPVDRLFLKG